MRRTGGGLNLDLAPCHCRARFERCEVFVGDVRLGCCSRRVRVCVSLSGVLFSVGVCVCDLLIFLLQSSSLWWTRPTRQSSPSTLRSR